MWYYGHPCHMKFLVSTLPVSKTQLYLASHFLVLVYRNSSSLLPSQTKTYHSVLVVNRRLMTNTSLLQLPSRLHFTLSTRIQCHWKEKNTTTDLNLCPWEYMASRNSKIFNQQKSQNFDLKGRLQLCSLMISAG
jgi:hypothetical protein